MDYNTAQHLSNNRSMVLIQTIAAATLALTTNSSEQMTLNPSLSFADANEDDDFGNILVEGTHRPSADRYAEIREHVILWSIIDGILFILIVCGNCLTIAAVQCSRRLRSVVSNLFILSLAISDLLVGLTIPYHLAFYLDVTLGESHFVCIMKFFFNIVACCVSIWNLIAIAVDRYVAIVYPLHYSRWITKRAAVTVIIFGWISGTLMGAIPIFWNNWATSTECEFDEVLPPWYMAGIVTPVFSLIWFCMLTLYWRIWREAYKHAKQLRASITGLHDGGHSDWKSVQVVILILGCFTVCWLPYFVVTCSQIFKFAANSSPTYYKAVFSLAMANSGMNPIIYAWKNRTFRRAFSHLLRCRAPDSHALIDDENARQNMKRKSSSLPPSLSAPPPTPSSIIIATPPPISVTDSYHRSSLHRYHHSYVTAFPLPPPPPSPQSPIQQSMETIVIAPKGTATAIPSSYVFENDSSSANSTLTKCCLKVVDMNNLNFRCGCDSDAPHIDIENNNDDQLNNQQYLHPNVQRWHMLTKNQLIIDDDVSKTNFKNFNNNNSYNELFLHKLTNNSPAESIVSAPLTPTGNLIVNILGNLESHHHATDTLNRKNYRNSTNCVVSRIANEQQTPSGMSVNTIAAAARTETMQNGNATKVPSPTTQPVAIPITSKTTPNGTVECVTIAINNNEATDTILQCCDDISSTKSNSLYCRRSYSLSSSAPQCINCWSEST